MIWSLTQGILYDLVAHNLYELVAHGDENAWLCARGARSARAARALNSHSAVFPGPLCRNSLYDDNNSSAKGKHMSNLFVSFTSLSL